MAFPGLCQSPLKPPIDTTDFVNWPFVSDPGVSDNGLFFYYNIHNQVPGRTSLVIKDKNKWEVSFPDAFLLKLSRNKAFIKKSNDTLCILSLGTDKSINIPGINSVDIIEKSGKEWLLSTTTRGEFTIQNLSTKKLSTIKNVKNYWKGLGGNILVLTTDSNGTLTLGWLRLEEGRLDDPIWSETAAADSITIENLVFNKRGDAFAFVRKNGQVNRSLWLYRKKTNRTDPVLFYRPAQFPGFEIAPRTDLRVSEDGKRIFFNLKEIGDSVAFKPVTGVDVWSYHDVKLQSRRILELMDKVPHLPRHYLHVVDIQTGAGIRLQYPDESIDFFEHRTDTLAYIMQRKADVGESLWNRYAKPNYYIVSTITGKRIPVAMPLLDISPKGNIAICMNETLTGYYQFDLKKRSMTSLTDRVQVPKNDPDIDYYPQLKPAEWRGLAGWSENGKSVFVYDKYDIWQIPLNESGNHVNITNGYGRRHDISFHLITNPDGLINPSKEYLLSAFNKRTKDNGFYRKVIKVMDNPDSLSMGPWLYSVYNNQVAMFEDKHDPIKAKNANVFVVRRECVNKSPNYFYTTDFKSYFPISDVKPESKCNWLTSELINYTALDGRTVKGILYKPENFDPQKRYPVIFHYYEKLSDRLHDYKVPEGFDGPINIPWLVSREYLVFTPDIHFEAGSPGESAVNSVVAAARFLGKLPFVDSTRYGIQGHSFGGFETNYIITHSNLFAAAVSASGPADYVSDYNAVALGSGLSMQNGYEQLMFRIGATLWEKRDLYFKNSPVLYADKINIPLLMMNNKLDGIVGFNQGLEFFTALRRLGKKVWMLQYDGQMHSLFSRFAKIDYTIRTTQFFDHYLKGTLPPIWMTRGIPAERKGNEDGFQLDVGVTSPGPTLLISDFDKK